MNKTVGFILTVIGSIFLLFFINYSADIIPLRGSGIIISLLVLAAGIYILIKQKKPAAGQLSAQKNKASQIERLVQHGEKLTLTLDDIDIRTRSYQNEIINTGVPSDTEMPEALFNENRTFKTEVINQTYIVFNRKYSSGSVKYISQPIKTDSFHLRKYIDEKGSIELYIDRADPNNYYFKLI
ncbi:MAG: hypothetical protein QM731_10690 [Chitinophagaceae bacterium]